MTAPTPRSATACNDPAETVIVTPVPPSCSGSQLAGSHTVGETFTIVFTPPCGFVSPPPVTKSVNGVPVGSQAATNGTASVTITVLSPTTLSVDDPVLVTAVCGTNTATASGTSATAQPVTQTATFVVVCPGPPGPPGPPAPRPARSARTARSARASGLLTPVVQLVTPVLHVVTDVLKAVTPVSASRELSRTGAPVSVQVRSAVSLVLVGLLLMAAGWAGDRRRRSPRGDPP